MKVSAVLTGAALFKNRDIALFAFEPLDRPGQVTFSVLLDSDWHGFDAAPEWTAVGIACAKYNDSADWIVVASSSEGHLWELTPGTGVERQLRIPGDYSDITGLASIENAVWAFGMDRLVLRREADGRWTDLSAPAGRLEEGVVGFNALGGVAPGALVAAGWKGEVWLQHRGQWEAQDCGTNSNFNALSVGPDGQVVLVGDNGCVVVGRRNHWTVLEVNVDFSLQGVCHFGGEVFICSDFELFRLENNVLLPETRFALGAEPKTCMHLFAGRDSAFSQGERDVLRYVDGLWTRAF